MIEGCALVVQWKKLTTALIRFIVVNQFMKMYLWSDLVRFSGKLDEF